MHAQTVMKYYDFRLLRNIFQWNLHLNPLQSWLKYPFNWHYVCPPW